jgi:long-chain acyl-CoA synthetase
MGKRYFEAEKLRDTRELVKRAVRINPDKIGFKELGPQKQILEYSYKRLEEDINALGTKLLAMGMKGQHIAILGENSYAWVVSYLSTISGVGIAIPMDKEMTDDDIAKLLNKSDADVIICSNTFAPAMKNILLNCPDVKTCIIMNPTGDYEGFYDMGELIEAGRVLLKEGIREFLDACIDRDVMCEIIFTSGTTGPNKGVMLSQKNIMAVVHGSMTLIKPEGPTFSVLPINHTYECCCHILPAIYCVGTIYFNDSLKRVTENMRLFKPTMSIMVPLFLESMYRGIWKQAENTGLAAHLRYAIKFSNLIRKIGIDKRRYYFKPILDTFGGNLSQIVCGGAPLREEIIKGLDSLGIEILNGYGITECAPLVSTNSILAKKRGSVGRLIPECRVRIDNPDETGYGEILVKGENVMLGYYKDSESTRQSFTEDGWFRTGDLGYLDGKGFLFLSGRKKNLIILSNGKNVHPEEIEEIISGKLPYVKEVVVYAPNSGASEECITACVYIDREFVTANGSMDFTEMLNKDIRVVNRSLPVYKRVNNVLISESEFEKTTTKKIKRTSIIGRSI